MAAATSFRPPGRMPATGLPPEQAAKTARAAQDFEAMALGQLLAPMFDTVDTAHGPFGGGAGEEAFKPMLVSEIGKTHRVAWGSRPRRADPRRDAARAGGAARRRPDNGKKTP